MLCYGTWLFHAFLCLVAQRKGMGINMEQLLEILNNMHPEVDFETEDDLIGEGILDSLDIVTLITEINNTFDVSIPAEEVIPENFNSAEAIMALIQRLDEE